MSKVNVFITGIGGGGVGEQILKALRLSTNQYNIIGGDMNTSSKGLMLVDKPYILPPASDSNYVEILIDLCKKHDVKALFYGSEPELKVMSENREIFADNGIFIPLNPKNVIDICMDKNKTMDWFKENGFCMPKSVSVNNKQQLLNIDFIPAVLKPSVGGGGSANTFIARNKKELEMFGSYMLELYGEFIVQQYVGTYNSEYTVGIMNDMDGKFINSIAVKKSIMSGLSNRIKVKNTSGFDEYGDYLAISSGVSQGEIGKFPMITNKCREIAEKIGATGPINIQCREQNGEIYVFEINPRISGTASLRAMVGYNEPDVMIRKYILGEDIKSDFEYKSGYITRGLEECYMNEEFMKKIERIEKTDIPTNSQKSGGGGVK